MLTARTSEIYALSTPAFNELFNPAADEQTNDEYAPESSMDIGNYEYDSASRSFFSEVRAIHSRFAAVPDEELSRFILKTLMEVI